MKTDIRVDVQFKDAAVYAGEDLACIITFRNIANPLAHRDLAAITSSARARPRPKLANDPRPATSVRSISAQNKPRITRPSIGSLQSPTTDHGRRQSTLSVSVGPNILAHARTKSSASAIPHQDFGTNPTKLHRRSFSAASIQSGPLSPISPSFPSSRRTSRIWHPQSPAQASDGPQDLPISPSFRTQRASVPISGPLLQDITERPPQSPRSSTTEILTLGSNHSQDTLVSELRGPLLGPSPFARSVSDRSDTETPSNEPKPTVRQPEHIMMAYVQTVGSFTLDGSLIDQTPFEQIKQLDIMTRGGVVGIEAQKPSTNFFGALTWSAIGDISLDAVLGKDQKSSIKDLKSTVNHKTIPLLSTPQSLLCVDLRLAPGEHKSCAYTFRLPRGLPPTHKGRAIKVNYHIKVGVQRPGELNSAKKRVTAVDIPFRVMGGVNDDGETLGHDLAAPHILRQDTAVTKDLPSTEKPGFLSTMSSTGSASFETGLADFTAYTGTLLDSRNPNEPLASPSVSKQLSLFPLMPSYTSMQERIDNAIARSNSSSLSPTSPDTSKLPQASNRFLIVKDNRYLGQLSLLRPAYRLGDSIIGMIDFSPQSSPSDDSSTTSTVTTTKVVQARQKTYTTTISLETTESIDPTLAQRSKQSIARATKKVYATRVLPCMYAESAGFELDIPMTATPGFETSGVALEWRLRIALGTASSASVSASASDPPDRGSSSPAATEPGIASAGDSVRLLMKQQDVGDAAVSESTLEAHEAEGRDEDQESAENTDGRKLNEEAEPSEHADAISAKTETSATARISSTGPLENNKAGNKKEKDRRKKDTVLVAREVLETEVLEILVPLRIYGVSSGFGDPAGGGGGSNTKGLEI